MVVKGEAKIIRVFIGYDDREAAAYHACANSIIRHSSMPVSVTPLSLNNLRGYKEIHRDGSNSFTYSRFLVPAISDFSGWSIYLDGDMLVRSDISELWELRDPFFAVMCVKHDYKTKHHLKYWNQKNEDYPRKNWSSVMLFNCNHLQLRNKLTLDYVQKASGKELHRFEWLEDRFIGELPVEWNWLVDEFGPNQDAKLIHYTAGTPCINEYACTPMADEWHRERMLLNYAKQI